MMVILCDCQAGASRPNAIIVRKLKIVDYLPKPFTIVEGIIKLLVC
jgi:hypothetical protein